MKPQLPQFSFLRQAIEKTLFHVDYVDLCVKKILLFYLQKNPEKLPRTLKTVLLSATLDPIGIGRREDFSCAIVSTSARSAQNCSHFSG